MRLVLSGANFEENLGVGFIAAAAAEAGHHVEVVPFNDPGDDVVGPILCARPDVVGLSIQFQHRAPEFLALAARLRAAGFRGHITCGGHFPTLAFREVLGSTPAIDTIVLHEGERTIVELLDAIAHRRRLAEVPGLAIRADDGAPIRTAGRPLVDLDALPVVARYRPHARHVGVPFIPILGSRGCWGACSYCSITSFYRDARAHGGGHTVRLRSPDSIAAEMATLWHRAGGEGVFCFHDDNFLLPRPKDTLDRLRAIRAALDGYGVGPVALIGKARPDCLTPALARELARLGVVRLYVGVENAAEEGARHLNRRTQTHHVHEALDACREAGIFVCYNLLLFEPGATLDDVADNVDFMRAHADHPVNFCRAEPYFGTPLHAGLAGAITGSFLGGNYRIADDRTELLFRIAAAAFRQRNFDPAGVGNRYMGVGYARSLLEFFHDDEDGRLPALSAHARDLTRGVALETADLLGEALAFARGADLADRDGIERFTALLGLRIAEADARWHRELDEIYAAFDRFAARARKPRVLPRMPRALVAMAKGLALGTGLASFVGCDPVPPPVVDPAPGDIGVVDPPPPDMARDIGVVDPAPVDMGQPRDLSHVSDPLPPDMARPNMDMGGVVDPPPPPTDMARPMGLLAPNPRALPIIDQWRETSPEDGVRTRDLPLYAPPHPALLGARDGEAIVATLHGLPAAASLRWEGDGRIEPDEGARRVTWRPAAPHDQLRVAVRTAGGVAVLALRAGSV